jgi:hypothetical protein
VKEGSKARKEEEEAREHGQRLESIPSLEETYQHAQWQSKMFRIGQPRGKRNVMGFPPPPAGYYTRSAKSVKEKPILQLSCVKEKDATCRQARPIQGMASTYSVHRGNVPQGQRGTQVDGHWHSYKCSTECSTEQGKAYSPAKRTI